MDLSDAQSVRLMQTDMVLSLNEYEKSKYAAMSKQNLLTSNDEALSNKFANILFYSNEICAKISEAALEMILFKYFIGELNMKKIVYELFKNYK